MKVFVTGATGFIGRHLVVRLAAAGHHLRCLVRLATNPASLCKAGATLVVGDVESPESLCLGMRDCDAAIHLANLYSFWERDRSAYRRVNVEGTRNFMEAALACGVARVVHLSTVAVYGRPADCPFTEDSAPGPVRFSEYARTKWDGDQIAWSYHREQGLPLAMLFPAAVLGPGDPKASGRYIADLVGRRLPAVVLPDAVLTWVHVRDVVEAITRVLDRPDLAGRKYIVGSCQHSIAELNQMVAEAAGVPLPRLRLPDPLALFGGGVLTALSRLTGRPPLWGMSLDQLRTTRAGFRADGSRAERELGLRYTPIRTAVAETVAQTRISAQKGLLLEENVGGLT